MTADPVVAGTANWAFNILIAGIEGEFVNLGNPVGFSGCLKFSRAGNRGALEITPYVNWLHHARSPVGGSNLRVGRWTASSEGELWFEPAGATLNIGVKAGWFFAFGKKKHEGDSGDN